MYIIGYSTPDRAMVFTDNQTHGVLTKRFAKAFDGASVWHNVAKGITYVGYFMHGQLVKP